jgi:hypothetical protein
MNGVAIVLFGNELSHPTDYDWIIRIFFILLNNLSHVEQ